MSMKAFRTSTGAHIHVNPIMITMGEAASFRVVVFSSTGAYDKNFNLEGVDYKNWGASDDYIKEYICDKEGFIGRPVPDIDADGNPIFYEPPSLPQDDSRSVHNEADIQRIQTLQEQLDEQKKKLEQITTLLFKNGAI